MAIIRDMKSDVAIKELYKLFREITDPFNDGYTQWDNKQSLIDIQYLLEDLLKSCPKFGKLEEEYINQKEQTKIIRLLKK